MSLSCELWLRRERGHVCELSVGSVILGLVWTRRSGLGRATAPVFLLPLRD